MPQDSMFPDQPDVIAIRLRVGEVTTTRGITWSAETQILRRGGDWSTLRSDRYEGLMTDCLPELGSEVLSAFLFGNGSTDVYRAAEGNLRVARAHKATYDRLPGAARF